jgi:type VI secretion system protein ImpA
MIRAKKLVPMGFIDIIKNMAPDGLSEIETIRGPEEDDDD